MKHLLLHLFMLTVFGLNVVIAQNENAIIPSTGSENGWFGASVSIDRNTAIIGAPGNPAYIGNAGSAFIYEREGNTWVEKARLSKRNGKEMELFGYAVSVSDTIALVGVPGDDIGYGRGSGSAFVYVRGENGWSQQTRLTANDARNAYEFGYSVDIDGNTAVVGAINANRNKGAAYIFVNTGMEWQQQAMLTANDSPEGALFGHSVAISGNYVIIGQPEGPAGGPGSAYIFVRSGTTWVQHAKLRADDGKVLDDFGISVDIDRSFAIAGAPKQDHGNGPEYDEGAAYIFNVPGGSQRAKLRITEGVEGYAGQFNVGTSVAVSGATAVVGAIGSGSSEGMTGASYLFSGNGWTQDTKILASNGTTEDFFGIAVSISNGCPLIGARRDGLLAYESGSAYIYCGNTTVASPADVKVDLAIHKPKVIDTQAPVIPDTDEMSTGAQTFVNLDNDDNDFKFDIEDPDGVDGEDDELILTEVKLEPADLSSGTITIEATAGTEYIRVWNNANKTAEATLPLSLEIADATVLGFVNKDNSLVKNLWVEGIKPHTTQRATTLKISYQDDANPCNDFCDDEVALTIIGVETQTWTGRQNGFTPDSISFDSNILDTDPNFPLNQAGNNKVKANRVFPGARSPNFSTPRDVVDLEIELTVAPVEDIDLFIKTLDSDDPSSDKIFIDPNDFPQNGTYFGTNINYSEEEDNRGSTVSVGKAGLLTDQDADGIAKITFTPLQKKQEIGFKVSHHPGDNYRAVANGDKDFLKQLRNLDSADGFRIVDPEVTGSAADREILSAVHNNEPGYASNIITVWRILHVENDAMLDPVNADPVFGYIQDMNASFSEIYVDIDLDLNDTSANLNSSQTASFKNCTNQPADNGRFENGTMVIADATEIQIDGNGKNFISIPGGANIAGEPLPFTFVDKNGGTLEGLVTGVIQDQGWRLTLSFPETPFESINWELFRDGYIDIKTGTMTITDVFPASASVEVEELMIPFQLTDDDKTTTINSSDISGTKIAFEDAYILTITDGGGNVDNNAKDVPFVRNTSTEDSGLLSIVSDTWGSRNNEFDYFWVTYVVSAHEFAPCLAFQGNIRGDGDPDHEQPVYGLTPPAGTTHSFNLATGGDVSFIFLEAERDGWVTSARRLWRKFDHHVNVAHEIGHQFGLHHAHEYLMEGTLTPNTPLSFNPQSINLIRGRVKSPGE